MIGMNIKWFVRLFLMASIIGLSNKVMDLDLSTTTLVVLLSITGIYCKVGFEVEMVIKKYGL